MGLILCPCFVEAKFSVYDLDAIMRAMNILADDLEMVVSMDRNYSNRINSTLAKSRELRRTVML